MYRYKVNGKMNTYIQTDPAIRIYIYIYIFMFMQKY